MHEPTIVYRGNFQPGIPVEERTSTESQIAATLRGMGCRVVEVQEEAPGGSGFTWEQTVAACKANEADLFLWTTTWNVDPDGGHRALEKMRAGGLPSASYHLDLFWELARQQQLLTHPFFRADHVWTADGGHPEQFARAGINHHWAEPAVFRAHATPGRRREEYDRWPVIFVGSYPYPHPEHTEARRQIIMWLQQRYHGRFRLYRGGIRNQALSDLYASATVIVGDSCLAGRIPRYWSERVPETLSRAGFLVHPYVPGIEDSYTDGEHLRVFEAGDLGQLAGIVDHYLDKPVEAAAIGLAGQQRVLERHTFEHRLTEVLQTAGIDIGLTYLKAVAEQVKAGA